MAAQRPSEAQQRSEDLLESAHSVFMQGPGLTGDSYWALHHPGLCPDTGVRQALSETP